jgi:UDP-N-acetylmuramyl pentapeptide phosphotransferase/UDP-N-acetylglucosamine-1-phosphate transferase
MSITFDPYAFGFAVVMHFFIVPWVVKHARKPRPNLPSSIKAAASILLTTGGIFVVVGVACGVLFTDLDRPWRLVWIAVASIGGALWMWNAFRLRAGIHSARWASIPFLLAAFPCLPFLGWIAAPAVAYCLFLDKDARKFFSGKESPNTALEPTATAP